MIPRRRTPVDAASFVASYLAARGDPAGAVGAFERAFAAYVGSRHAVASCSGRTAFVATLLALGLTPGDEVLLPAYTLADIATTIRSAGLVPVFADVDARTLLLDAAAVERAITPRTRAIVPTDIFGMAAPWDEALGDLAARAGAVLVEDAAHAAGTRIDGAPVGRRCRAAFFSLETIKVMHSFGGGVVVTDDADVAARVRARLPKGSPPASYLPLKFARNAVENVAFRTPAYGAALAAMELEPVRRAMLATYDTMKSAGVLTSFAFEGWQAAYASRQLDALDARVDRRRALAARLTGALDGLFEPQREPARCRGNGYFAVGATRLAPRALRRRLLALGVDVGIHHEITDFCPPESEAARFPNAWRAHERLVQLPLYDAMSDAEADRVARAVRRVLTDRG